MKKLLPILSLIAAVLLAGCKKDTPEVKPPQEPSEPLEIMVVQPETTGKKIESVADDGSITFVGLTNDEIPKVGTAICSGPTEGAPQGFLYKVKEVATSNGKTIVKTEFASLEQVVENGEAHHTIEMTEDNIVEVSDGEGKSLNYTMLPAAKDGSSGAHIEINKKNLFGHQDAYLKGTLDLRVKYDFDLVFKNYSLKKFTALVYPEVKMDLSIGMAVKKELKGEILLGRIRLAPTTILIPTPAGPIPVVVTPQFNIYAHLSTAGMIEISTKLIEWEAKKEYGIAYNDNEGWSFPGFETQNNQDLTDISFMKSLQVSLAGEIKAEPRLLGSFSIYNIDTGVGVGMGVYGKLKFEIPTECFLGPSPSTLPENIPEMTLTAGANAVYKADLKILKIKLADLSGSFDVLKWDIWKRPVFPAFSDVTHHKNTQGDIVVKCTIKELPMSAFGISQHGFCWVEGLGTPTVHGQHNELGELSTLMFENMGEQDMEVVLKNLKPNTTYTVRPYYTTWLGTFYPKQYLFITDENGNETPSGDYGIEMVHVQGGVFMMGNNVGYYDQSPVHMVTLSDFYIGKTEVTQAQWKAVMGNNQSANVGDDLPAERVSWEDVQLFIKRLNQLTGKQYRLPTEAEWEYAARGGQKSKAYKYAGSDNIDEVAWWKGNSENKTHPVATKAPNELGLYDMSGNVWEWCNDWYAKDYYANSPDTNPTGPDTGNSRVLRGGAFTGKFYNSGPSECECTERFYTNPTSRSSDRGFRLVHPK